ncbi:MAG: hypothetical protein HQL52_06625 [Magnetococcales bacterium]|nr:hypothetical protein [Magnetococcales bacterium]
MMGGAATGFGMGFGFGHGLFGGVWMVFIWLLPIVLILWALEVLFDKGK